MGKDIAQNPKQKTNLTASQPQIGTEASPVIVETHSRAKSEAESAEAKADREHTARIEGWTLFFTGAAALFTGLLVWVGWRGVNAAMRTLREIEKQALLMDGQLKEMQEARKQAAKQLAVTERPWLSVNLKTFGPLTVGDTETRIQLLAEVTNVGRSLAIGIDIHPVIYLPRMDKPNIVEELKRISNERVALSSVNFGSMLFPGSAPLVQPWNIPALATDIEECSIGGVFYMIQIIVCVAYRSTIDESARLCTAVVYDLFRTDPQQPGFLRSFRKGESVPVDRLLLMPSPLLAPIAK